ncbi:hypothetical protein GFS24_08020 [Chitinophaga sp. SYP-B3965]|uniref:hypothetical protein n=1 Tax=Chitinophaga sp. SYP-B3965 TaxID=2663120 RepID=UPI001299E825|nr:hypothetical protein [Chitinophaga sp. SYP-B3965]MRG45057.1 hypothetical protein [Chitinophaga sp. SYP-B3965]
MDTGITLAIINSATLIFIAIRQEWANRKIIKEKKQESLKWQVFFNTEDIKQLTELQQAYSMHVQKVKDQLRALRKDAGKIIPAEREKKINVLQEEVISQYANSRYYYNNTQKGVLAHRIKTHLLETLLLLDTLHPDLKEIDTLLELITRYQLELDCGINSEIRKMRGQLHESINKN